MSSDSVVTVVTPTTGAPELIDALISVANQNYLGGIEHLVVVDGQEFVPAVERVIEQSGTNPTIMVLPNNTGAGGWNGHRIYAAIPDLVNSKYVAFLDQDNWFTKNHISSLISTIEQNEKLHTVFSLRSLYDKQKNYIGEDNSESLGKWPVWNSGGKAFLIDTSCFLFKTEFIRQTSRLWLVKLVADRNFTMFLKEKFFDSYETNGMYTMCYRLGSTANSVSKEFILLGNEYYREIYKNSKFPWVK